MTRFNKLKEFIVNRQQQVVLVIGYLLVAALGFTLGQLVNVPNSGPEIKLVETNTVPDNYTPTTAGLQSNSQCLVKGTISSKIYHIRGQSGYDRLTGQACFETESAAQEAGYRKALR